MREEQVFGARYRTIGVVGDGGMARVYRAVDERLGRLVAVKTLHPQYADQPAFVARFEQEAHLAASLNHPNIVGIFDSGHDDNGPYYIVMEYVEGENLAGLIQREGPLALPLALPICRQLCAALDYAHDNHIIHRDIKPGNIFLTADHHVKVGDFGIARALDVQGMTLTGNVLGSVSYFSPEQAQDGPTTAQSDLYSVGVVLYEMLTRRLPYVAESSLAVVMKHINEPAEPPSTFNPRLSSGVDAVVLKAMAKDPAQRYRSGAELIAALEILSAPAPAVTLPSSRRVTRPLPPAARPDSTVGAHPWPMVTDMSTDGWSRRRARPPVRRARLLAPPLVALLLLGSLAATFALNGLKLPSFSLAGPYSYVAAWATHQLSAGTAHPPTNRPDTTPATALTTSTPPVPLSRPPADTASTLTSQKASAGGNQRPGVRGAFTFAQNIGSGFTPIDPTDHFNMGSTSLVTAIARWTPAPRGQQAMFTWITPAGEHESWSDPTKCRSEFSICYVQVSLPAPGTYHVNFFLGSTQVAAGQFVVSGSH